MDASRQGSHAPTSRPVRRDLVGREVGGRALQPLIEVVRATGADAAGLAAGTGYAFAHLANPRERISWAGFARFAANVGEHLGAAGLIAAGGRSLESPVFRALVLPGRLLDPIAIYLWAMGPSGPAQQLIAAIDGAITRVGPAQLRLELRMKPGYAPSRENHLLLEGALAAMARVLGMPSAEVVRTEVADGAIYDVRLPERRGVLGAVRRRATWLVAARANARELERANAELNERYLELQREIEARVRAEAELRRTNEDLERRVAERTAALEAANAELASFSYTVSHDLRAPLRALDGFSRALLDDAGERLLAHERGYLDRIRAGTARMGDLIDGLLQLARVTRAEMQCTAIDLGALATTVLDDLASSEPERRVAATVASPLPTFGDQRLLFLVMQNLVGNAWKFTRRTERAEIEVGVRRDDGGDVYFVRDNGAGFDMAYADRLFSPFQRLHAASEFPGSGIGLATVHRIVTRHGGRLWADARVGLGATFAFTLPPP
ncbi:MAG: hypothetical protein KIT31_27350 [Deltaproteobacteria bacterium]|nr:hypothetical protein [Deltaproteobacteria bacterium]